MLVHRLQLWHNIETAPSHYWTVRIVSTILFLMLVHRLRRCSNIKSALDQCFIAKLLQAVHVHWEVIARSTSSCVVIVVCLWHAGRVCHYGAPAVIINDYLHIYIRWPEPTQLPLRSALHLCFPVGRVLPQRSNISEDTPPHCSLVSDDTLIKPTCDNLTKPTCEFTFMKHMAYLWIYLCEA